jgi:hypothetical protein
VVFLDAVTGTSSIEGAVREFSRVLADGGFLVAAAANPAQLRDVESEVSKYFREVIPLRLGTAVVSTFAASDPPASPDLSDLKSVPVFDSGESFVVASDGTFHLDEGSVTVGLPADLGSWSAWSAQAFDVARAAQAHSQPEEALLADRDHLIRELFEAEQALAEAFDVRTRLEGLAAREPEQQTAVRDARRALESKQAEIDLLRGELHRVRKAAQDAHDYVVALQSSTSWRVTRPLRLLARILRSTSPPS